MKKKPLYSIKNVKFSYTLGSQKISALKKVSLEIPSHSFITFSGPSGSGKSTLLNLLGLIEDLQDGDLLFQGKDFHKLSNRQKNRIRKKRIGFIFQQFHLVPVLTAQENVEYFLSRQKLSKKEIKARAKEALIAVGLWEHRKKKPLELSGGQRQRVAIARAIAKRPDVIIGDEPTASLDQATGKEIMEIFAKLVREKGVSIVIATHDPMVQSYSDQNFHIHDGYLMDHTVKEKAL